jgi:class 3 adenylate cyclase
VAGTVVICFTDIVGSTELLTRLGDERFDDLRRVHFDLLERQVEAHGGEVVKSLGDGLMLAFGSASDAVSAAVAMQRAIDAASRGAADRVAMRVGISAGDATREGDDWYGVPVVEGSRLCAVAEPGQILVSEVVRLLSGSRGGHEFRSLGALELKGIPEPVGAADVAWTPATAALAAPLPGPLAPDEGERPFAGRDVALDQLGAEWKAAAAGERRVVMIAGEPGVGKTRLVAELARSVHADGALVLLGRTDEHVDAPYGPWREALRALVRSAPEAVLDCHVAEHGGELARIVPELARRVEELPAAAATDPETERLLLFEAVAGLVAATSAEAPVLLVLEALLHYGGAGPSAPPRDAGWVICPAWNRPRWCICLPAEPHGEPASCPICVQRNSAAAGQRSGRVFGTHRPNSTRKSCHYLSASADRLYVALGVVANDQKGGIMHTPRWGRRIGSALLATGLLAAMAATAGPAAANEGRADTRTSLTASPSASSVGQPVTLTATVSFAKSGTRTPTGLVYFGASNGHTLVYLGSASVTGCSLVTSKCSATLVTTSLPEGSDAVGALYGGNQYFGPSAGLTSATVTAQPPGAPSLTSATASSGQVVLQWSAPITGGPVTSYNVYRSGTQGVQGPLLASGVTATTYTDLSAPNDSTYYYVVTAVNGAGPSPASNELSAHPPSSSATACSAGVACASPTVTSSDLSTSLQVTSGPSAGPQTLTLQVGGLSAMQCTLPGSGSVISQYHTSAADAGKVADYTVFGDAAVFANAFYAAHPDISGCYGSPDPFNGYSPAPPACEVECQAGTWANGPYVYGPAPFDASTGLYEAFLGSCANHGGYQPCFTNINGGTYNTTEVHSPASPHDPRISH